MVQPRAVIYLRQSRDADNDRLAVDRQRKDCTTLCTSRGWAITNEVVDNDVSASTGVRAGWTKVLQLAESGAVDVIVGWHVDRLTRKLTELEHLVDLSARTGVKVATFSGDLDLTTDSGRLVGRILASVARGEVERKSARQSAAGRQAADQGRPPSGNRAYGYSKTGEIIPAEADIVREVFTRFNAGASLSSITKWLNTSTSGNRLGRPWSITVARNLLRNARYAGIRTYHGEEVRQGTWTPIVDEAVFRAANATLADPGRATYVGSRARKHLGSGRYECGKCGRSTVRVAYNGRYGYRVYRCPECSHTRRADPIDDYVSRVMAARLRRPDLADILTAEAPDLEPLRKRARALRAKLNVIADDYYEERLTGAQAKRATARATTDLAAAEAQLADAGRGSALAEIAASDDPGTAWLDADLGIKGAVLDQLATITILTVRSGPREFDPASVAVDWRTA